VVDNPPRLPREVIVFPQRDFVSIAGFVPNADVLIQARRNGVVSDAIGRTDATGLIEVNHPGGVCWRNVTPDLVAGDVVRVTYRDTVNNRALPTAVVAGSGAATTTMNVTATQAFEDADGSVKIKGQATLANGTRVPLNRFEVRIINPEFIDPPNSRIARRDIRATSAVGGIDGIAGATATLAYDGPGVNTFTVVFTGLNPFERLLAVAGETRVLGWQQTTAAGDRLGLTIFEAGAIGGPGLGGCPPGPGGVIAPQAPPAPVASHPPNLLDAAAPVNQASLKDVVVFPERDFVSIDGFAPGTDLQVVVRRPSAGAAAPIVGTARGTVGRGGLLEVNHPGGVCWRGQTPNITAGDWIDVFQVVDMGFSAGQTQRVIDARVTRGAFLTSTGEVRINGTAVDANGAPLPLNLMEQRVINPDFVGTRVGRRDIRADVTGGRVGDIPAARGNLLRDAASNEWRAVYSGLNAAEQQVALAGQSRALAWLSTNANGDRFGLTIFEAGEIGGPGFGGCPAPGSASIALP
jgi:hypothetical protein